MFAKNKTELINKLKALEGKAVFKLIRENSFNDGEFLRVLHKVRNKDIIFIDDNIKECYLNIPNATELKILENGFMVMNCKYELIKIFNV